MRLQALILVALAAVACSSSSSSSGSTGGGSGSTTGSSGSSGTTGFACPGASIGTANITLSSGYPYGSGLSAVIYRGGCSGTFDATNVEVLVTNHSTDQVSGVCALGATEEQQGNLATGDLTFFRVHVGYGDGGVVQPGTYAIDGSGTQVTATMWRGQDTHAGSDTEPFASGSITLDAVGATQISGSFSAQGLTGGNARFSGLDPLSGSFTANPCP